VSAQRFWTVEEARAALPRLRQKLAMLQRTTVLATRVRSNGHADIGRHFPETDRGIHPSTLGPSTQGDPGEELSSSDIQPILEELEDSGIVLRDPAKGLIDFPAMHLGRTVHLCWQLGEDDLGWWHFPDDGFAGRRPLPLPTEW
jgi:Uncharacterized conserved protein (DUF2203)